MNRRELFGGLAILGVPTTPPELEAIPQEDQAAEIPHGRVVEDDGYVTYYNTTSTWAKPVIVWRSPGTWRRAFDRNSVAPGGYISLAPGPARMVVAWSWR